MGGHRRNAGGGSRDHTSSCACRAKRQLRCLARRWIDRIGVRSPPRYSPRTLAGATAWASPRRSRGQERIAPPRNKCAPRFVVLAKERRVPSRSNAGLRCHLTHWAVPSSAHRSVLVVAPAYDEPLFRPQPALRRSAPPCARQDRCCARRSLLGA